MTKPSERPDVFNEQVTESFERPDVFNEWVTKSFEQFDVSNEWAAKLFKQIYVSNKQPDAGFSVEAGNRRIPPPVKTKVAACSGYEICLCVPFFFNKV